MTDQLSVQVMVLAMVPNLEKAKAPRLEMLTDRLSGQAKEQAMVANWESRMVQWMGWS